MTARPPTTAQLAAPTRTATGRPIPVTAPPAGVVLAVCAAALLAVWWHGPLLDLHIYRLGGSAARHGGDDLYALRDRATGLPFTYTPFAAFLFAPLAVISEPAAAVVVTALSVAAAVRLSGLIADQWLPAAAQRSRAAGTVLVALAASEPVISTVLFGQINLILFTLAAEAVLRPANRWGAIGLGIAAGIKLTPAIFILGLFGCGRWREGCRATAATAATVVVGAVYLGRPSVVFFSGTGFQDTRIGGTGYISNQSLNGLLWRVTGPGGQRGWWIAFAIAVLVATLWSARRFAVRADALSAMASLTLAGLLLSPVSWSHHWVGAVLIAAALSRTGRRPIAAGCWLTVTSSWVDLDGAVRRRCRVPAQPFPAAPGQRLRRTGSGDRCRAHRARDRSTTTGPSPLTSPGPIRKVGRWRTTRYPTPRYWSSEPGCPAWSLRPRQPMPDAG